MTRFTIRNGRRASGSIDARFLKRVESTPTGTVVVLDFGDPHGEQSLPFTLLTFSPPRDAPQPDQRPSAQLTPD